MHANEQNITIAYAFYPEELLYVSVEIHAVRDIVQGHSGDKFSCSAHTHTHTHTLLCFCRDTVETVKVSGANQ